MDERDTNSWSEWRKHVLLEIERINENLERMNEKHVSLCLEVAKLRAYSAVWGAIGGGVITLMVALVVSIIINRG